MRRPTRKSRSPWLCGVLMSLAGCTTPWRDQLPPMPSAIYAKTPAEPEAQTTHSGSPFATEREPGGAAKPATLPAPAGAEGASKAGTVPREYTLDELEAIAVRVNPILRRDVAQIDSARGSAVQAGLFPNPHYDTNNPLVFNGRGSLFNAGFQQEIPVAGKKRLDQAAANENTAQQVIATDQDKFTLLTNIRVQFYTLLADQKRIAVLTELVEVGRQSVEAAEKLQKAGDAKLADVLLIQTDYQRLLANLHSAQAIQDGDRKQLGAIVGQPGLVTGNVKGNFDGEYPRFDEAALLAYVSRNHTSIRNLQSVVVQNQYLLRRAEVEPIPNPTLGPAYQYGVVPGNDNFWFNISFIIPTWDRNQGNIRAAKGTLAASVAQVGATRNDLINQAANQLSLYLGSLELVLEFERTILPKSREAARLVRDGYAKGIIDLPTFLQAQRTLVQASSDYVDALQAMWTNAAQVAGLLQQERFAAGPGTKSAPSDSVLPTPKGEVPPMSETLPKS